MTDLISWAVAAAAFAFVMTFTPGPNNIMLATSGANFGLRRTMPHVLGVAIGFPFMLVVVAMGFDVMTRSEVILTVLRVLGAGFVLYLAYKIFTTRSFGGDKSGTPLSFWQAASFQWVNPKAWAQALGALSAYVTLEIDPSLQSAGLALIFLAIGIASSLTWAAFGERIACYLSTPTRLKLFNTSMATLLIVTIAPAFLM